MHNLTENLLDLSKETNLLDLTKSFPKLESLKGVLSWSAHPLFKDSFTQGFDLDIFAFCLNHSGKIESPKNVVFYGNSGSKGDSIYIPSDNRTGGTEEIIIDLNNLPRGFGSVELYTFLFESEKRSQVLSMMVDAKFILYDSKTGNVLQAYRLDSFKDATGVHLGTVLRTSSGFEFHPVGTPTTSNANKIVGGYL